jgi:hypothetical protein
MADPLVDLFVRGIGLPENTDINNTRKGDQ